MFLEHTNIIFYIITYLICSIPFGLVYTKLFTDVDLLSLGSGSIGATNVLRVLKQKNHPLAKKLGALTLASDLLKILVLLVVAKYSFNLGENALWFMSFVAILGHCYSIFLSFEGGKGVATFFGISIFMMPLETVAGLVVWGVLAKTLKISSISSLLSVGSILLLLYFFNFSNISSLVPMVLIYAIIFGKHIPNIMRLFKNEEKQLYNIHINGLSFKAIIGILDFERVKKQRVIVDFSSTYDNSIEFVDYGYVARKIKKMIKKNKYFLIEDALSDIENKMYKKYKTIKNINIKITKPNIIKSCTVGVSTFISN